MTNKKWKATVAVIGIIIALGGLGFAAMSTNPPFTIPTWLPSMFFVLAGFLAVALLIYLMWEQVTRVRFQYPIILINQHSPKKEVSTTTALKQLIPPQLIYDGVLWEERLGASRNFYAGGPLCPKDLTPLAIKSKYGNSLLTDLPEDALISDSDSHLYCIQCTVEYTLGQRSKRIRDSRNEAGIILEGMRRRARETQES